MQIIVQRRLLHVGWYDMALTLCQINAQLIKIWQYELSNNLLHEGIIPVRKVIITYYIINIHCWLYSVLVFITFFVLKPTIILDKIRKRTSSTTVAFHACFSNDVNYLGRSQTLIFDRVITDTNTGYSRSSGTYRIPRTGFYVITWVTPVVGNIPFELLVNGEQRGRTDPSSTGNGASQSTSGIAVLSLYQNDNLSIRTHPSASPVGALVSNTWQDACFSLWSI